LKVVGLDDVVERRQVHRPNGRVIRGVAGHQDYRHGKRPLLKRFQELDAGHARHLVVEKDKVERRLAQHVRPVLGPFEALPRHAPAPPARPEEMPEVASSSIKQDECHRGSSLATETC